MKNIILLAFILGLSQWCQAQNNLFAVLVKGDVRTVNDNNLLKKGSKIETGAVIRLAEKSALTCVDKDGNTYLTEQSGLIPYEQLFKNKKMTNNFTIKVIKIIWNELFNNNGITESLIGGPLRGLGVMTNLHNPEADTLTEYTDPDNYLMQYPFNSSLVNVNDVMLEWEPEDMFTNTYFVFIRQKGHEEFARIRVAGTKLDLSKQIALRPDQEWEWAVLGVENEDSTPTYTFSFSTLSETDIESRIDPYKISVEELRELGFSREEINWVIYNATGISRR